MRQILVYGDSVTWGIGTKPLRRSLHDAWPSFEARKSAHLRMRNVESCISDSAERTTPATPREQR